MELSSFPPRPREGEGGDSSRFLGSEAKPQAGVEAGEKKAWLPTELGAYRKLLSRERGVPGSLMLGDVGIVALRVVGGGVFGIVSSTSGTSKFPKPLGEKVGGGAALLVLATADGRGIK